ncbi:hypothetical protein LTR10_007072 [Elasticomyces elasticus]|nr:hypothetical protein LTR10_007072 [Elasticomyces elasticus]KAK4978890.1 hypothetical protein LTR42_001390 [Elasticomyces elasticus]
MANMSDHNSEKSNDDYVSNEATPTNLESNNRTGLKLDRQGLPLVPQPSDHPDDPLNFSRWFKVYIAVLISGLAFIAQAGAGFINPAFRLLAKDLDVTVVEASYCTTVFILFGGILSMFTIPFANVYGRRICYIVGTIVGAVGAFVSAAASTYGGVITGRVLNGASVFDLDLEQTGLFMGVPLTVGCMIGEATAGWVSDWIINAYARRHNGYRKPEVRLYLLPLTTLLAIGTATFGYCIQARKHWIYASVCMAISGLGSQVGTTMVYTYATDAYKPQSGEVGSVINLAKSIFTFNIGFYALPFSEAVGFDMSFTTVAAINLALLLPLVGLAWKGEKIREWQGTPKDHTDI